MLGTLAGPQGTGSSLSPTIRAQSSQELVQHGALALGSSRPAEAMTRAGEASPKLPHLPPRLQRPAPGRYLGPRLGSTPNRQRRVAPGAARSGSGCGSQAAGRGPPPTPAVEPPSGDDPARRLPHPRCSLWAYRTAPSWKGGLGPSVRVHYLPGTEGLPASSMQWAARAVPSPSGGGLGRGVRTRPLSELLAR